MHKLLRFSTVYSIRLVLGCNLADAISHMHCSAYQCTVLHSCSKQGACQAIRVAASAGDMCSSNGCQAPACCSHSPHQAVCQHA